MRLFTKKKQQDGGTPADDQAQTQDVELAEDACPTCGGSGLIGNPAGANRICDNCQGTGKGTGNAPAGDYPEGTNVITKDGTYVVVNGQLVKQ